MNYEQARFNMIEQQIRPWEVLDSQVLSLLALIRREDFVPTACRTQPARRLKSAAALSCTRFFSDTLPTTGPP